MHRCLQDKALQYLSNYCVPVSEVASHQQLRSASRYQLLLIPRYRLRTFGRRAFAVADPNFWNSLAKELRIYSIDRFKLALKTSSLLLTSVFSALEAFAVMRYINWWFDIDRIFFSVSNTVISIVINTFTVYIHTKCMNAWCSGVIYTHTYADLLTVTINHSAIYAMA